MICVEFFFFTIYRVTGDGADDGDQLVVALKTTEGELNAEDRSEESLDVHCSTARLRINGKSRVQQ